MPRLVLNTLVKRGAFSAIKGMTWFGEMVWFGSLALPLSLSLSTSVFLCRLTHSFVFFCKKSVKGQPRFGVEKAAICSEQPRLVECVFFTFISPSFLKLWLRFSEKLVGIEVTAASVVSHGPIS